MVSADIKRSIELAREDILVYKKSKVLIEQLEGQIEECRHLKTYIAFPNALRNEIERAGKLTLSIRNSLPKPKNGLDVGENKNRLYTILTRITAFLELMLDYTNDIAYLKQKFREIENELKLEEILIKNAF